MTNVQKVDREVDIKIINKILEKDGCIVIMNAINSKQLEKLRDELKPHLEETPNCSGDFYGYKTKRISSLISKSSICRDLTIDPIVLAVMDEFLLRSCTDYQLSLTQAIQIGPGEPQQVMHPDDPMYPFSLPDNEKMINCMWAIDDFTKENGATHIVPGSHKWKRVGLMPERQPKEHEIIQGAMPAGSVLIYFGSLLHCGGANKTLKPRTGMVTSYSLGWLRQSENSYLAVPQGLAKTLPERLQRLLGYFVHQPNLGQIEGRDPIEILQNKDIVNKEFREFIPNDVLKILEEHRKSLQAA
ncbi:MAG: hypothetical protein COA45_12290 [Zetaproteobacteria bacterium]|nr:MAG: hypothetical protein COA45_12290 [Zetaproteobacteria bacterium]